MRSPGLALVLAVMAMPVWADDFADARAEIDAAVAAAREAAAGNEDTLAVIAADVAFSAAAQEKHVSEAFAERWLDDGYLVGKTGDPAIGPEAVRAALAGSKASWYWGPAAGTASGDLGVTWGHAALKLPPAAEGETPGVLRTRYVTAWKRGADGVWRIWLDLGTEPVPHGQ